MFEGSLTWQQYDGSKHAKAPLLRYWRVNKFRKCLQGGEGARPHLVSQKKK